MMEMRMEIESLKLAETDPGRKGNSLFAEVEDQRQAMERQLINYKTNNNILKNQFDLKTQEAAKLKLQVASLLSLSSNRASMEYVSHVEESLASARAQLQTFAQRCRQLEEAQQTMAEASCHESPDEMDHAATQLFKNLYTESKKKQAELNQLLHQAQFDKVVLSDRILQLQRKLRQLETTVDASHGEVIRLRVKLDDLACKKGEKAGNDVKKVKLVLQKLPVFDAQQPTTPTTVLPEPTTPTTVLPEPTTVLPEPTTPPLSCQSPPPPPRPAKPTTPTTVLPEPTTPTTVLPEPSTHHETATHPETTAQHNPTTQQEVPQRTLQAQRNKRSQRNKSPQHTQKAQHTQTPQHTQKPQHTQTQQRTQKACHSRRSWWTQQQQHKQEVTEHTNTIRSSEGVALGNEENLPPLHPETRKKPKKTVQLTEVVTVHLSDGKVQETKIKQEDGLKKVERKHKPLRKLECPVTQVGGGGGEQIEECKTQ
ncbi:Protein Spindly [Chionoecetes opilio]|uniref:Protein Spindly n=1 Tax=Chionoecetes opilio TaxID=41210 RepID=A0A8J4XX49_CHIOP|nr:Protein Spindly [Chionoecetes opilio]